MESNKNSDITSISSESAKPITYLFERILRLLDLLDLLLKLESDNTTIDTKGVREIIADVKKEMKKIS